MNYRSIFMSILIVGLCMPTIFHAMEQESFMCKVPSQAEVKQKVAREEMYAGGWVSKTFNVPEKLFSVAVGKDNQGNPIILAGGTGCVYLTDAVTGTTTKLVLPGPQVQFYSPNVMKEVPEEIRSLKIVSHNRFLAQSKSHVRLCDMQGKILQQMQDASHYHEGSQFTGIGMEVDKFGKPLVCLTKAARYRSRNASVLTMSRSPFRDVDVARFSDKDITSQCFIGKDKQGSLKILHIGKVYDAYTCALDTTKSIADILVEDPEKRTKQIIQVYDKGAALTASNTRTLGNACFASASENGTVKLWTNPKELEKEKTDAEIASFAYQGLPPTNVQHGCERSVLTRTVCDYVGVDAYQALAEIQHKKEAETADFVYAKLPQAGLQRMVCDYVGADAHQALSELAKDKESIPAPPGGPR